MLPTGLKFGFIASIVLALLLSGGANAKFTHQLLDNTASSFSKRPVTVECKTLFEDPQLALSWGYVEVPLETTTVINLDEVLCAGALAVDIDAPDVTDFFKVFGTSTLIHEAFHLKNTRGNYNEAVTECRALINGDRALRKLGAEPSTLNRLMPKYIAVSLIYMREHPDYDYKQCKIPKRYDKWLGDPPK